ncbi:apelin receptor B-like [Erpetoichthys calabaricus]|uniref:Apelin receptor 2 n=1 Tax=Erpetoichthys calabaricus TaxID=27687 RepID=A0A8C4SA67_ERPCA|nr:apelin receptor B-like [Erpetoichthys calabaricus]
MGSHSAAATLLVTPNISDFFSALSSLETPILEDYMECDYKDWAPTLAIIPTVYILVFIVGSLGNGLVLKVYLQWPWTSSKLLHNQRHSKAGSRGLTDSFIASLALADLAFVFTLPLWAAYTSLGYNWPFGTTLCKLSSYLVVINMYASVFSLTCLSVERYFAIVRSLSFPWRMREGRSWLQLVPVITIWGLAAILGLPALIFRTAKLRLSEEHDLEELEVALDQREGSMSCEMDYSLLSPDADELAWNVALGLKSTLLGFVLPLVVMMLCYWSVGRAVFRHFGRRNLAMRSGRAGDASLEIRRQQRRLLSIIITLVCAFLTCWLPYHLNKTLSILTDLGLIPYSCSFDRFLVLAHPYATCLAYVNSCLNPLLYAYFDPSFRRRCAALLACNWTTAFTRRIAHFRSKMNEGAADFSNASEKDGKSHQHCGDSYLSEGSPPSGDTDNSE